MGAWPFVVPSQRKYQRKRHFFANALRQKAALPRVLWHAARLFLSGGQGEVTEVQNTCKINDTSQEKTRANGG